tara:strand:- start:888 stop:2297 length:1410 start_codon:yes stop_codon:yes gene_type:complete
MQKKIKVVELFAGVGGFRLGLEGCNGKSASSNYKKKIDSNYEVVWSNQWEPSTKMQHANLVYEKHWGNKNHYGDDINKVANPDFSDKKVKEFIPEHDLLVGGFPCQDYSVAGVNTNGIEGKKGVLWWNIHKILKSRRPSYVFLENVDRLLKSPTNQRGRDFAIILSTMTKLGYDVEWRVINAADYGMPQRRRRVFIMGYHKNSNIQISNIDSWLKNKGILVKSFPGIQKGAIKEFVIESDPKLLSENFDYGKFLNCGAIKAKNKKVLTFDYTPEVEVNELLNYSKFHLLGDVVKEVNNSSIEVKRDFIIDNNKKLNKSLKKKQKAGAKLSYIDVDKEDNVVMVKDLDKWKYLKGKKQEERTSALGVFYYNEGPMSLHDSLDKPSRTIITSEGGPGASRFKHLIELEKDKKYRRLIPEELELLNMFPLEHTNLNGQISDTKRAFFMGNALVIGVIERVGKVLHQFISTDL